MIHKLTFNLYLPCNYHLNYQTSAINYCLNSSYHIVDAQRLKLEEKQVKTIQFQLFNLIKFTIKL